MRSNDYYFASLYILTYLTASRILDFFFSFLSFNINYVGFDGATDFVKIGLALFFILLSLFAVYQIFKKTMLGFHAGTALYVLEIILALEGLFALGFAFGQYLFIVGSIITRLILNSMLFIVLRKSKNEFK